MSGLPQRQADPAAGVNIRDTYPEGAIAMFTVQQWKFIRLIGRRAVPFSASAQPADRTGRPRSDALARTNRSNERRRFLGPVLAFVLAWVPLAANAQAEKPPRVGLLGSYSPTSPLYEAFRQGLRELGYVEGRNLIIEARFADGKLDRLPEFARELAPRTEDYNTSYPKLRIAVRGVCGLLRREPGDTRNVGSWHDSDEPITAGHVRSLG